MMSFIMNDLFIEILQSPLKRLRELVLCGDFENDEQRQYLHILIHYLAGEPEELELLLNMIVPHSEIALIGRLRLQNLQGQYSESQIDLVHTIALSSNHYAGEAAFALGMSHLRFKNNLAAKDAFKLSYQKLTEMGALKKASKALLNLVVSESRIDNKKRLIHDYEVVASKAKAAGALEVEGICYQNISKELHILGLFELALKYSNSALALQEDGFDSVHFYETLLHRCHVLIDLGRFKEAYFDFERAKLSRHVQTIEALKCIEKILGGQTTTFEEKHLEPAWLSKLTNIDIKPNQATRLEMNFIDLIKGNRLSKDDIVMKLYGENTDWESAKNRFKVFLSRFRKKYPGLVEEENNYLFMVDESILSDLKSAL
jgi:tetratricopeptide (TPR) repeat protein